MKEVLCFIYDGFADFETVLTCSPLNEDGNYKVTYIAYEKTPVYSSGGLKINPDKKVSEINSLKDIEGLIIPGGGTRILKPELEKLIKQLNEEKKLLAAICAYEQLNEKDPFPRDTYVETRVIQDGNIITAKGFAFTDFALKIWDWFDLYDHDGEKEELKNQFTPT